MDAATSARREHNNAVITLGREFASAVAAVGSDVSRFAVGDRVVGFDDSGWGGHAEHKAVAAIPDGVSVEQAAAATEGAHYALVDQRSARVGRGTRLFVHGATGAIGSAAVQLGKYLGAHVVATSTGRVIDVVSALGPDRVIDHERLHRRRRAVRRRVRSRRQELVRGL